MSFCEKPRPCGSEGLIGRGASGRHFTRGRASPQEPSGEGADELRSRCPGQSQEFLSSKTDGRKVMGVRFPPPGTKDAKRNSSFEAAPYYFSGRRSFHSGARSPVPPPTLEI